MVAWGHERVATCAGVPKRVEQALPFRGVSAEQGAGGSEAPRDGWERCAGALNDRAIVGGLGFARGVALPTEATAKDGRDGGVRSRRSHEDGRCGRTEVVTRKGGEAPTRGLTGAPAIAGLGQVFNGERLTVPCVKRSDTSRSIGRPLTRYGPLADGRPSGRTATARRPAAGRRGSLAQVTGSSPFSTEASSAEDGLTATEGLPKRRRGPMVRTVQAGRGAFLRKASAGPPVKEVSPPVLVVGLAQRYSLHDGSCIVVA